MGPVKFQACLREHEKNISLTIHFSLDVHNNLRSKSFFVMSLYTYVKIFIVIYEVFKMKMSTAAYRRSAMGEKRIDCKEYIAQQQKCE